MIRIILILFFAWITAVQAEIVTIEKRGVADDIIKCEWENQEGVPCVTIRKSLPNSNAISDKVSPTTIITKKQIEENNLIDLEEYRPKILFMLKYFFKERGDIIVNRLKKIKCKKFDFKIDDINWYLKKCYLL